MTRILGLGDNTVDVCVDAGVQYPGGNAVNVAAMCARLGAVTGYLGCVGDDDAGDLVRKALTIEGVDLTRTRIRPGPNARTYIGHLEGDRKFNGADPGVRADYRWEEADFDYISIFDHVHTSIYGELGDALPRIAASTRSLSFDLSNRWSPSYLTQVLPSVRFAFLSAPDMSGTNALSVAEDCLALGAETVVLNRGSGGALGLDAQGPIYQPALPTLLVDTLGAGDGFISGFIMEMLTGGSLCHAMKRGAEFAAMVCGWHGGFGHAAPSKGDTEVARWPTRN